MHESGVRGRERERELVRVSLSSALSRSSLWRCRGYLLRLLRSGGEWEGNGLFNGVSIHHLLTLMLVVLERRHLMCLLKKINYSQCI